MSNDQAVLEIFFVEELRNLIGQKNFVAKAQELDFSQACGFHRK